MKSLPFKIWLVLCLSFTWNALDAQSARERSVELSVDLETNPGALLFQWPADASADQYTVYKKALEATEWGTPIMFLDGSATSFTDATVSAGEANEYAVFKKRYELVRDTICVPSGIALSFNINDMYGIGLCCNFGFGYYEVELCGDIVAYGDNFGFGDSANFAVCSNGNPCENVIISLAPDMFPNSTSWVLTETNTGDTLATSGEVGDFISDRSEYGFIYAGYEVPAIEQRGTILLLIEETINNALPTELDRLALDLIAEGWKVIRRTAQKEESVVDVRSRIQEVFTEQPELSTLFIIGHVPVPYSGDIYPDTHSENHQGAWAADTYYGELNGNWTDEVANITTAFFERNHNIPGDGRFDQDSIPSPMELEVGRVDFFNMPAFALDETALTQRYLDKDHLFRKGQIDVERRALVDDNFGNAFAAPAASGWRNFATMFGADAIDELDYFTTMNDNGYLWSYGCGSGSHVSSAGIGTTNDFAADSLQTVFTMLFGSQFGDWDNENNFLKAPLASGLTLTNCWAGSPAWTFHHMALGHHIGYSAIRTQNSRNEVYLNGPQLVHTALMGDPSLTMHVVKPPKDLSVVSDGTTVNLDWSPPENETVVGYYLYRSTSLNGDFERISTSIISNTTYTDTPPSNGDYYYLLRALKLETSGSGSYFNLSSGLIDSTDFVLGTELAEAAFPQIILYPNPSKGLLQINGWPTLEEYQITLTDAMGRLVWQSSAYGNTVSLQLPATLTSGVYLVKLSDGEMIWTERLILD